MQEQLNQALGLHAFLEDADKAGYLDQQELQAVQKARADFGISCQRIALDHLHRHGDRISAGQAINRELDGAFELSRANPDEVDLVRGLGDKLTASVEREAAKSNWQRNVTRFALHVPAVVWLLLVAGAVTGIAIAAGKIFQG